LWKFNVIIGLCGLKNLRKGGRLVGSRKKNQSNLPLRDFKPLFVGEVKNLGGHRI
jgi:hypothetical protein